MKKQLKKFVNITFLALILGSLILSVLPIESIISQTFLTSSSKENFDVQLLKGDSNKAEIPRLMNEGQQSKNKYDYIDSTKDYQSSNFTTNFAFGSHTGVGGGGYSATDLYNWTGSKFLNLQNSFADTVNRTNNISIVPPTSYTQENINFQLDNVQSISDWEHVENDVSNAIQRLSNSFPAIGQQFVVSETYVNITSVTIYLYYNDLSVDGDTPQGFLQIMNNTGTSPNDKPDKVLGKIALESHFSDNAGTSTGWETYTFSMPINLSIGTYYIVLNDTTDDWGTDGVWGWYTVEDSVDEDYDNWYQYSVGTWYKDPLGTYRDVVSMYRYVITDSSHDVKIFTNPTDIGMNYTGGLQQLTLSSFSFTGNESTNQHKFNSTVSVSFDLTFTMNCNYSNIISVTSSYFTENGTITNWNTSFITSLIDNATYSIYNRTITINGLQNDWDGSAIYHGGTTLVYNDTNEGLFNNSVVYTNRSSTIIINASTLTSTTEWDIVFDAPNYLYDFNISLSGTLLDLPYETYTMNDYSLDFKVNETGNLTYRIEYSNGSKLIRQNINEGSTVFSDTWDIDSTFDLTTRMNGTYQLQAFYNNSDLTKVGTYTRNVTMYVNTSFSTAAETQIIIGQLFNATTYYTADHNSDTDILNAPIWCDINWTSSSDKFMTQNVTDDSYNASFATNLETEGTVGNLTFVTQMPWFENWTETILVYFVKNSTLNVNEDDLILEWRENYTLEIKYNVTPGGASIPSATITVNNTDVTNYTNGIYYFKFNTTDYNGVGSYLNLKVIASHTNYQTRLLNFNLTITDGLTNITGTYNGLPHDNKTDLETQYFSNSSADTFTLSLRYYHMLTDDTLKTTTPTVDSDIPNSGPSEESNNNWTIIFDPDSTGIFVINISFSMAANYTNAFFMFNVTILDARTKLQTDYSNNTEVLYGKSYEFAIFFNNTDWNENITFNGPYDINDSDKLQFINRTGDLFWFNFSHNSLFIDIATHSINITFILTDFQSSSLLVHFNVIQSPFVDIIGVDDLDGTPLTNGTSTYTKNYSPNEYDNFSISISYFANITSDILDNIPIVSANTTIWYNSKEQGNFNWTFIFNGSALGSFIINITFSHENYTSLTFTVRYIIQAADTQITDQSIDPVPSQTIVISGTTFDFWLVWQSEYNENINDSIVEGNGTSTNISLLSSNPLTGNHTLRLTAPNIGIYTYNLTFLLANYTRTVFLVRFNITRRNFLIDDALSRPANGSTSIQVKFGNVHNFSIYLRDLITNNPIDVPISNITVSTNMSFILISPTGNHTFNYSANQQGSFDLLTINFSFANYYNISYYISFTVYDRFMYVNATLSKHDSGETIDTLQYGELYYFTVFLKDNETETPVNATIKLIDFGITFTGVLNDGNHSFYYNATSIDDFDLQIVFNSSNYKDVIYFISFEVSSRVMTLDQGLTTHGSPPVILPYSLHYGDLFYFYIYLNDSRTAIILNISSFSSLPPNIFFENFSLAKGHLFRYDAIQKGTFQNQIDFDLSNYNSYSYTIGFTTVEAESTLITSSSSISTYYTVDVGFSIVWQSIPNSQVPTSPTLRINDNSPGFQFGSALWSNNVQFSGKNNGNFTFSLIANQTGSFTVTISFGSGNFENQSILITINILQVSTLLGGSTTPANNSIVGETTFLYYSKTYDFDIHWLENINNSGVVDSSALISGSGLNYVANIYQTSPNGVHQFTYHGNATGTYQVIITLGTTNFANLVFEITFIVTIMPTNALTADNVDFNESILVEDVLYINGSGFETFESELVPSISVISLWINGSVIPEREFEMTSVQYQFWINFTTEGYEWGTYNLTVKLETTGYQPQSLNITITLLGRDMILTVNVPLETIKGQPIEITANLKYESGAGAAGIGSGISLASLSDIDVTFRIGLNYPNGSTRYFEETKKTDVLGNASFTIDGLYTKSATGFAEVSVTAATSSSGLATSYSMSTEDLIQYNIIQILNPFEILLPALIVLILVVAFVGSGYAINRKRKTRSKTKLRGEQKVEQSFEDIKSIRLIIARHESGLQFFSEKTIAELATDTDALSGMSAAISSFMEEVSDGMSSRSGEEKRHEIEMMSREGLHMLIWHGKYSSLIIISEIRLPDYFQDRLKGLGKELENKFAEDLQNFYSSDQIPSSVVKKMVRKFIPLHYFSAFILNEGVLTLESIKLSGAQKKMLKDIKNIRFIKGGIQFFFSEQIISQLSKRWKRAEAIKFLNKAIDWNLLIEASQEDLLNIKD